MADKNDEQSNNRRTIYPPTYPPTCPPKLEERRRNVERNAAADAVGSKLGVQMLDVRLFGRRERRPQLLSFLSFLSAK
jgi:hypothetical protein